MLVQWGCEMLWINLMFNNQPNVLFTSKVTVHNNDQHWKKLEGMVLLNGIIQHYTINLVSNDTNHHHHNQHYHHHSLTFIIIYIIIFIVILDFLSHHRVSIHHQCEQSAKIFISAFYFFFKQCAYQCNEKTTWYELILYSINNTTCYLPSLPPSITMTSCRNASNGAVFKWYHTTS